MKSLALALLGIVFVLVITLFVMSFTNRSETYKFQTAHEPTVEKLEISGIGRIYYQYLFTEVSEKGETLPVFLRRVGRVLHNYTKANGNEACGPIASDGSRYSVRLHTDGVPQGCALRAGDVLEGFTFTGETIHSHPWQKLLVMTPKARAWSNLYKDGNEGALTLRNDGASGFSKVDRANGDGWLVAGGQLLHFSHGKTERLGPIDTD